MKRLLPLVLLVPVAGCASGIEFPLDGDHLRSGFADRPAPEGSRSTFESGFLGGSILDRALFMGSLPLEAFRFANEMENRIVHEGYEERKRIFDDPSGWKEAERQRLERKLLHPDPAIRQEALAKIHFSADGPQTHYHRIVQLLDDPNAQVRHMAMKALGDYWQPATFPRLAERLRDADTFNRIEAARQVREFDADLAVPTLLEAISIEAVDMVRMHMVEALATFAKDRRVLPSLVALLDDPNAIVRDQALTSLAELAGGEDLGFDPFGEPEERRQALERWRAWLETARSGR